jgi:hypothetical protein
MAKLYLIRRNLETFVGPLALSEMKEAYKRMDFGLQDEVSGHCGPWVTFEDLAAIKKTYPEIARIVHEDMLAGWGVSDHAGARIGAEDTKRIQVNTGKGVGLALTFLVIALAAFAAAVYMANGNRMSGKAAPAVDLTPEAAQSLLDKGDEQQFNALIEANLPTLVERVNRAKNPDAGWTPYLRHYAFNHDGQIDGLAPKLLRGSSAPSAPVDCSLKMWRRRWRTSLKLWNGFVTERRLIRAHWARVLAWDPHWIRRRAAKGWLPGENFYIGCLSMAEKALTEMQTDTSLVTTSADWEKMGIVKIAQRLQWLQGSARGYSIGATRSVASPDNPISLWTCYEAAGDFKELGKCRDAVQSGSDQDAWYLYSEERYSWNLLRIAAGQKGNLSTDALNLLGQQAARVGRTDFFTRFDYRPEQRLFKTLLKQGVPVEKSVEKAESEFPDIRLSH